MQTQIERSGDTYGSFATGRGRTKEAARRDAILRLRKLVSSLEKGEQ